MIAALFLAASFARAQAPSEEPPPLTSPPALVTFQEAPYPEAAKAAGLEATVMLAIEIDATGTVTDVQVLAPLEAPLANQGFEAAAVDAARAMRFSPAQDATGPVPVVIEFAYRFTLAPPAPTEPPPEAAPEVVDEDAPVTLEGELREMGTRRPLSGFVVRAEPLGEGSAERTAREAVSDATGAFAFKGLPPGRWSLRAGQPGWDVASQPVEVRADEVVRATLWLRNQAYADNGIVGLYRVPTADVSRRSISMDEVKRVPGTFGDPVRVVQNLPGAARAPFGTGLLVIRGSNPEDSGVYVDGIRIPYIYHLGGFASVINPDLVQAVDYLPGGFGARYGRGMGGVIDVTTRQEMPERTKVTWNTDLLDTGVMASGRAGAKKQHGWGIAARRSYIDAFLPFFLGDDGFTIKPRWYDYQAKYVYQGDAPWDLSVLAFGFEDVLRATNPSGTSRGTDPAAQGELGTDYSTHRLVVDATLPLTEDWAFRLTPAFGRDDANFGLGNDLRVQQGQWLAEIRAEAPWTPSEHLKVVPGVDFIGGLSDFDVRFPFNPASAADFDPLAEREPFGFADTQAGWGPDAYVFAEWRPLKDKDRLLLTPGVRMLALTIPGELSLLAFDPRLSGKWQVDAATLLKSSVGLYHQPPQAFQMYRRGDTRVDLDPQVSTSVSLGVERTFGPAWKADVEAFYKDYDDLIVNNRDFRTLADQFFTNEGVGRTYGVETMIRRERVGNAFGWVSYTLSRSERTDHPGETTYLFDFDQTHILVALAGYRLPYDFEVSGKAEYTTGNPTTPYALGIYDVDQDRYQGFPSGDRNSERLPPYAALSLRVDKLFTFRTWQLSVYCDLLNVARGVNPEFEVYNYDYTERTYVRGLPFLPSPGFEAKFEL